MPGRMLQYVVNTNLNGVNGYARNPLTIIYNTQVAAATNTGLAVPNLSAIGQMVSPTPTANPQVLAVINYQAATTVFVAVATTTNGVTTAAPDTSGTFVAKPSIINPQALMVNGGDTIYFYVPGASTAFVSVEFYFVN